MYSVYLTLMHFSSLLILPAVLNKSSEGELGIQTENYFTSEM